MALSAHCYFCFDVLSARLHREQDPPVPDFADDAFPLFVTWHLANRGSPRLRGCIGNFNALHLHDGLREYAIISAMSDTRFSPITKEELPKLTCSVSLLTNFEDAQGYLDWEIGVHGIWIEFKSAQGKSKTATYLPEVAQEQGWSKEEAIDSLLRKAGYHGHINESLRQSIVLTRYQSSKVTVSYQDWMMQRKSGGDGNGREQAQSSSSSSSYVNGHRRRG